MYTILIAGAGQLGSRHLQGVKSSLHELDIWVYDLSLESLRIAEERYYQVDSKVPKTVHFVSELIHVPKSIDIVIVSSGSKPRASIIKNILASKSVQYMILEKFLFTRLNEYDEIDALIKVNGVKSWVNCPRRMFKAYEYIKSKIDVSSTVEMSYIGGEWGMCCNTIHFVDIFMFLVGESNYELNIDGLRNEVFDSKRAGYVEVIGTELFITPRLNKLKLISALDFVGTPCVTIKCGNNHIEYYEGTGQLYINGICEDFQVPYQSELSGVLVDELIQTKNCRLTTYEESALYHKNFLREIGPFINKIKGWSSDSCPIT